MKHYIVLRNCPPEAKRLEGRWHHFGGPITAYHVPVMQGHNAGVVSFYPTGQFEERDDGTKAEVFEPPVGPCPDKGENDAHTM